MRQQQLSTASIDMTLAVNGFSSLDSNNSTALRKHLRYSLHNRDDVMEDDDDDTHMQEL